MLDYFASDGYTNCTVFDVHNTRKIESETSSRNRNSDTEPLRSGLHIAPNLPAKLPIGSKLLPSLLIPRIPSG